jgi:membrane-associated phospholipid phosphatase
MSAEPRRGNGTTGRGASTASAGVFTAHPGGIAAALGRRFGARRPVLAALAVWVIAFVVLGVVMVGLGLLLTHVLLPAGVGRFDASVSRWFVLQRTQVLDTVTRIGSDLGSTGVVLGIAALAIIVLAIGKHWRQIGFLVCALTLEFAVFLVTTIFVGRQRPPVVRLDVSPPTSSYPSGHTATALTLYVGLAIVLWSLIRRGLLRTLVWVLAIVLPIVVGISRLYRGMHFPTDVIASVLLGCGALLFALLATRSVTAAEAERDRRALSPPSATPPPEVTS